MGIPYYFSYLIKNHSLIISNIKFLNNNIHNLFLDCNSLIYDSLDFTKFQANDQFESYIIENHFLFTKTPKYYYKYKKKNKKKIFFINQKKGV
jgi:5'-3' exonuclease